MTPTRLETPAAGGNDQVKAVNKSPPRDCPRCARLAAFRHEWQDRQPEWHNAPVPRFGDPNARLLVVGLAPGLRGANRSGRPFTGDGAGNTLYPALAAFGFSTGRYQARADDGLALVDCAVTNAVRCAPPGNRPSGEEVRTCREYLLADIRSLQRLRIILALGRIAHESVLRALGRRPAEAAFSHGGRHELGALTLHSSYHCSRYNINTRRLTEAAFSEIFARIRSELNALPAQNREFRLET